MRQSFTHLRGTRARIWTADVLVAFLLRPQLAAAVRAMRGHHEGSLRAITRLQHRAEHLGDYIARLAQKDHVTNQDALAFNLVRVVQRGHCHGRAGYLDRLHHREGSDATRASHIDLDVQKASAHHLGRVLEGDGPTRCARGLPELHLQIEAVDLDHDAIDLVLDVVAMHAVMGDELADARRAVVYAHAVTHRQAVRRKHLVPLTLSIKHDAINRTDAMHGEVERLQAGECALELGLQSSDLAGTAVALGFRACQPQFILTAIDALAERARRGIARVGERR